KGLLGLDARKEAIAATMAQEDLADTVEVRTLPGGLLVDFCREIGAGAVVRGLRSQLDLAYEEPMARMNRHLAEIDTVFLLTESSLAHISSSLVREVHALGGEVSNMLPGPPSRRSSPPRTYPDRFPARPHPLLHEQDGTIMSTETSSNSP